MKNNKASGKQTLRNVMKYIKKYTFFAILSIVLAAIIVALTLYLPILTGIANDCILGKGNVDMDRIMKILMKIGVVVLITAFAQWIMNLCNNKIAYGVINDIRKDAFEKLEILPLKYIDSHQHGEIVSRVITDVDTFAEGLLLGFTQLFTGVITIVGTLFFMLTINIKITGVVVIITPISLFVASFIAKKTYKMFKKQSETRGEQTAFIDEMIGNQKVVKAFGREDETLEKFDEMNERLRNCSLNAIFFSSITNPSTRFVNSLVYTGVGISGGLTAIANPGALSVGQLSCF